MVVPMVPEYRAGDGLPDERCAMPLSRLQTKHHHRLVGVLRLDPVEIDEELLSLTHDKTAPSSQS